LRLLSTGLASGQKLLAEYGDRVKFVYKHLPLNSASEPLSRSAYCAGRQGKFWEYHDLLFANPNRNQTSLTDFAAGLGLDTKQFSACQKSDESLRAVRAQALQAKSLGIDGTPAFIINGKLTAGALSYEQFKAIIDSALNNRAEALRPN
jgi:protein-disulfide isomerase